jgi:hypothetical protein
MSGQAAIRPMRVPVVLLAMLCAAGPAAAQRPDVAAQLAAQAQRIAALEAELAALRARNSSIIVDAEKVTIDAKRATIDSFTVLIDGRLSIDLNAPDINIKGAEEVPIKGSKVPGN